MSDVIYHAKLTDLQSAISRFPVADNTLMILERLPVAWLDRDVLKTAIRFEEFNLQEQFNSWERGRIFNKQAELRWEKFGELFQAVYVGPNHITLPDSFNLANDIDLAQADCQPQSYYLWGQKLTASQLKDIHQPPEAHLYLELQVSRLLAYPVQSPKNRVKLQVMEYRDTETQQVIYHRYQGVKAA